MYRKEFLKICGIGCLGLASGSLLLESCASVKYIEGTLNNEFLEIPLSAFEVVKKGETKHRKYVVIQHQKLQYPICVYRNSNAEYTALGVV